MFDPPTSLAEQPPVGHGKLLADPKALRLDMDISADRVVLEELASWSNRGSKGGGNEGI